MAVIEITNLSRVYGFGEATTIALDNVSFEVSKGEFVAIMGPSGSGKSTLLNIIGLLDTPTHGSYKLDGKPVAGLGGNARAKIRREQIGFIFQSFNLLPRMTVLDNVALPLMYKKVGLTKRLEAASKILNQLGLGNREYYRPNQLSGGQTQRVAIARALVNKPSIILADEPTGNLDSKTGAELADVFNKLNKAGNTIIMVTHDAELAQHASRVINLLDGGIHTDVSAKKITITETKTPSKPTTGKTVKRTLRKPKSSKRRRNNVSL
jgi:putative ABC transport system ATP-binding protein